jgi:deoxyribonuclease V
MKGRTLHPWNVSPQQAQQIQQELRSRLIIAPLTGPVRRVAGVDVGFHGAMARAAVVVLRYPELDLIDQSVVERPVTFPYVPGLLSFREVPALLDACAGITHDPDLIIADGQGYAHPRRLGFAAHLGLLLDLPTIGCAKSRLIGEHGPVPEAAGAWTPLHDGGEVIGAVVRTKEGTAPLYISIGHRVDLETAIMWVLRCCRGHRLPEPSRLAHAAASGEKQSPPPAGVQGSLWDQVT